MSRILNWAFIGCGIISDNHFEAVSETKNAKIYAVCDKDTNRAVEKKEKYHAKKMYTDYEEMLTNPKIDVVSICTPSGMHGDMAIRAASAKKHILCEKPMEVTAEKMTEMTDAVEKNKVKFGCVFQRRTSSTVVSVKRFIDEHDLGPIIFAEARMKYYRSREYFKSADWRATWDMDGGGALMNQGVHGVDLLQWFAGDIATVYATCKTLARDINVEDAAAAVLEFKTGGIGTIRAATCIYPAQETQISLHFKTGSIIFGDSGVSVCKFDDPSLTMTKVGEAGQNPASDAKKSAPSHLPLTQDMVDAVLNDREPHIPLREARKSVDLILAIYESSKKRKVIKF